jgi:hypothetical protein
VGWVRKFVVVRVVSIVICHLVAGNRFLFYYILACKIFGFLKLVLLVNKGEHYYTGFFFFFFEVWHLFKLECY